MLKETKLRPEKRLNKTKTILMPTPFNFVDCWGSVMAKTVRED